MTEAPDALMFSTGAFDAGHDLCLPWTVVVHRF